jgi:transcriptional regulator with XRE-family HTH domain
MKFGEKLKVQREKRGITLDELSKAVGVSTRTLVSYEQGASHPKSRNMYYKLADYFLVDVNYFLTEDEEFLTVAAEKYGRTGQAQAKMLLEGAAALFAGGELSENDQLAFLRDMQSLYLDSKELARDKYTPKKYRK